jgi:hypothetical protein
VSLKAVLPHSEFVASKPYHDDPFANVCSIVTLLNEVVSNVGMR